MIVRNTISFCPVCYKEIPAVVDMQSDGVFLKKRCDAHGDFGAMLERSPVYYEFCMRAAATNIYNGYFLDVTQRCNLRCEYCYHAIDNSKDPSVEALKAEALINSWRAPIILHGGEPTIREDLVDVVRAISSVAPGVEVLTNGTNLDVDALKPFITEPNGMLRINLSMHAEAKGADYELLNRFASKGERIESVLFVIDDLRKIDHIIHFGRSYKNVVEAIRIKAATCLWAEQKPDNKIFVSDMLGYIRENYRYDTMWWRNNKTSFFNLQIDGMCYMLVSWYDINNVDLLDIACPPYYRAKNGRIENIVTACLINEGMQKGWLNGERIGE